jgi:hypothetical protein
MGPRKCQDVEQRLRVAAVDKLHLAIDGRSLCGRLEVADKDTYDDQAGLLAWNGGPLERCGQCSRTLVARSRQTTQALAPAPTESAG